MVSELAFAEFFHVLFGIMWVGTSIYFEVVLAGLLLRVRRMGEFRTWQSILQKSGPFQIVSSIMVVVTGLIYMVLRYGTDLGAIWNSPSGSLVLISLILVLVAIFIGSVVLTPRLMKLTKMPMPEDADAPIPNEVHPILKQLVNFSLVSTTIIVFVLFLMVAAAQGGF